MDELQAAPLLVIVSGAPGSGKTILARRLGAQLRLPVIAKDDLKEVLYDTLGVRDLDGSARLGRAAFALLYVIGGRLLDAGAGLILEGNFYGGWAEPELALLARRARAVLIHCEGSPDVIVRRYTERAERGERHPGHADREVVSRLRQQLAGGVFQPLALDVPMLRVDTTTMVEYVPAFGEIVALLRR